MVEVLVRVLVVSLILVALAPWPASAASNRIIVEPFANSTGEDSLDHLSEGLSDLLVAYLSGYEGLEILYREDLHTIWRELAQNRSGLERADTLRIGSLIQANTLIKGGLVRINGRFRANVHVYDIATSELRYSVEASEDIGRVDALASSIAAGIADNLLSGASVQQLVPMDAQPLINTHFMKGVGYYFNGLYEHAAAEFMSVLDLDPARADARLWLGRSYSGGGESGHARIEYRRFLREFPDHQNTYTATKELATLAKDLP